MVKVRVTARKVVNHINKHNLPSETYHDLNRAYKEVYRDLNNGTPRTGPTILMMADMINMLAKNTKS